MSNKYARSSGADARLALRVCQAVRSRQTPSKTGSERVGYASLSIGGLVTVFCPNCGKPNTDTATSCVSCGTELKPSGPRAGKFKGTMMMSGVNAPPPGGVPSPQGPPPGGPPPAPRPPAGGPVQAGSPQAKQGMAYQKTMLGPMSPQGAPPKPQSAPPPPSSPPPSGGFGAPPPSQGGGGFGAPPPSQSGTSEGSQGGFGAPPAQASQSGGGGGWGQPPQGGGGGGFGGAPPPQGGGGGGFGGAPPPQGGGGGGFGGPPPGGGGFGGAPQAAPQAAPPKKSKKGLIFGLLGCLFLLLIGCIVGGYLACKAAEEGAQQMGSSVGAELNRIPLTFTLGGIQMSCTGDPSGASAVTYFHPSVASQYQSQACQITNTTVEAFNDANRSQAQMLNGTEDEGHATALGLDPTQCTRFTSGAAKIIACNISDAEGFKIIYMENPGSVQ